MKQLKIAVPEYDWYDEPDQMTNDPVLLTRQEIHGLIKAHAEKLGWDCGDNASWYYESSIIELDQFGDVWFYNINVNMAKTDIKDVKGVEISPFDFLKLTLEDVKVDDINKCLCKSTTTKCNEKAEKEIWVKMPIYDNRKSVVVALADSGYNVRMEKVLIDRVFDRYDYYVVFNLSNEFLKQAGNS